MDHYIEARVLPDPEFTAPLLMGVLYSKLHRSLVSMQADNLGISFPDYGLQPKKLGDRFRIHGTRPALGQLLESDWLRGMADHLAPVEVQPAPATDQYVLVKRKQYKTGADRLRRRRMKRHGETYLQACESIPDTLTAKVDLPFVTLRSMSTGQNFPLFIDQQQRDKPGDGVFNTYGLSRHATVPWF